MENNPRENCCKRWTKLEITLLVILLIILVLLFSFFLIWLIVPDGDSGPCVSKHCLRTSLRLTQYMDPSIDPCDNFYDFVCGNFIKKYSHVYQITSPMELELRKTKSILRQIRSDPIKPDEDTKSLVSLKKMYKSCMDVATIDGDQNRGIKNLIEKVGGFPVVKGPYWTPTPWTEMTMRARKSGLKFDWLVEVDQKDGLPQVTRPRTYHSIPHRGDNRQYYLQLMRLVVESLGAPKMSAGHEMEATLQFEEQLVQLVQRNASKTYQNVMISDLQKEWPVVNWVQFLNELMAPTLQTNLTYDDSVRSDLLEGNYFQEFDKLMARTSKRTIGNYFMWKTVYTLLPVGSKSIRDAFDAYRLIQNEVSVPREETCAVFVEQNLFKGAIADEFFRRYVNQDTKEAIETMLDQIKETLLVQIDQNTWMDEETKEKATNRTRLVKYFIGRYGEISDEAELDKFEFDSDNVVEMLTEIQRHKNNTNFAKINVDESAEEELLGDVDVTVINAHINTVMGFVLLTAPVTQPDFFDSKAPTIMNFASLGFFCSHEFGHLFDNIDADYMNPETDKIEPWITQESLLKYAGRIECLIDEYLRYHKNLTRNTLKEPNKMSECIADFIGLDLAYKSYQETLHKLGDPDPVYLPNLGDFTENQLFWIQVATDMCFNPEVKSDLDTIAADEMHPEPRFRILASFRNSKYFSRDFNCPSGSQMNAEEKCDLI